MNFIPFENFQIISQLPLDTVREKLVMATDEKILFRNKKTTKPFEGIVKKDHFHINRILNYRNSSYPIISGYMEYKHSQLTVIRIRMRMTVFSIIFMCIWFLMTGTFFFMVLEEQLQNVKMEYESLITASLFFIIGYLLMIIGFNYEAAKAKKILCDLL